MSSIARVIFFVELTARMRCRYSRICAPIRFRLPGSSASGRGLTGGRVRGTRPFGSAPLLDDLLLLGLLGLGRGVVLGLVARPDAVGTGALEELALEGLDLALERLLGLLLELARLADGREEVALGAAQVVEELGLEAAHVLDGDAVELAGGAEPDRDDLLLDRERR